MEQCLDECGYTIRHSMYNDWNGKPIERTPDKYRYSYDAYVVSKKADEYQHAVYSDRLLQWDYDKHNRLCKKHFGNEGQYWGSRGEENIEAFLRDYYEKPELQLVGIMTGCNVSNGYPYWIFMFDCDFGGEANEAITLRLCVVPFTKLR